MATGTTLMTADDLLRISADHTKRYELVEGELHIMAPASFDHGIVTNDLGVLLSNFANEHKLGKVCAAETGFIVRRDPDTVRAPDSSFLSNERLKKYGRPKNGYYPIGPDLAVEILSPGEDDDVEKKVEDWFAGGVRRVWYVGRRQKTVTVYCSPQDFRVLNVRDTLHGEDVLPGFSCPVSQIFA